jgi:hypothetical protein
LSISGRDLPELAEEPWCPRRTKNTRVAGRGGEGSDVAGVERRGRARPGTEAGTYGGCQADDGRRRRTSNEEEEGQCRKIDGSPENVGPYNVFSAQSTW